MSGRRLRRRMTSGLMTGVVITLAGLAVLPLLLIFGYLVAKGATSINLDFFLKTPVPAGQTGGGVAHAIVGSAIVVGLSRRSMGFFSALAGAVALAVILVPLIARTTEEMIKLVPHSLREAALALGYPRWRTSLGVVVRTALTGIVTGALVGVARVAGETAPLLFTALGNLNFSVTLTQPIQALPLQIYVYAQGPFEEWHRLAWAAALVLMALVLVLSLLARWATRARYGTR
jgi:phosphate transport system permease protein